MDVKNENASPLTHSHASRWSSLLAAAGFCQLGLQHDTASSPGFPDDRSRRDKGFSDNRRKRSPFIVYSSHHHGLLSSILSLLPGLWLLPKLLSQVSILHVYPIVYKTAPWDYPTSNSNSTHLTLNSAQSSFSPQPQQTWPALATRSTHLGKGCPHQVSEAKHLGVMLVGRRTKRD